MIAAQASLLAIVMFTVAPTPNPHGGGPYRGPEAVVPPGGEQDGANVMKFHDGSTIAEYEVDEDFRLHPFLPYASPYQWIGNSRSELETSVDASSLVSLVRKLYAREFEYEGRHIDVDSRGKLVVVGPEGLHQRIEELFAFLDGVVNAQVELAVDVLDLPAAGAGGLPSDLGASVLPAADAQRLLESVGPTSRRASYRLNVPVNRSASLDLARDLPVVFDYDVEIAQAAAIADPIVGIVSVGTRLEVRAAPSSGGLLLSAVISRGELIDGEVKDRIVSSSSPVSLTDSIRFVETASVYQSADVLASSIAFDTWLEDGMALVVQAEVDVAGGKKREAIILRKVRGKLPAMQSFVFDSEGHELTAFNLNFGGAPRTVAEGTIMNRRFAQHQRLSSYYYDDPVLSAGIAQGFIDDVQDALMRRTDYVAAVRYGQHLLLAPYAGDAETRDGFTRESRVVRERALSLEGRPSVLDLSIRLRRVGRSGKASDGGSAHVRLPVRSGDSCSIALGVETSEIIDYDVEVAQQVSIPDAKVEAVLDGLVLWLRPSVGPGGRLSLAVRGGAHLLDGERTRLELGSRVIETLEQSSHDHLILDEEIVLDPGPNGGWSVVFGDTGDGGPGALRLEIDVRQ